MTGSQPKDAMAKGSTQMMEFSIGRDPASSIVLDHPSVSARHATITFDGDALLITDQGSSNGVFVDGQKMPKARIRPGNEVRCGTAPLPWSHPQLADVAAMLPPGPVPQPPVESAPAHPPATAKKRGAGCLVAILLVTVLLLGCGAAAGYCFLIYLPGQVVEQVVSTATSAGAASTTTSEGTAASDPMTPNTATSATANVATAAPSAGTDGSVGTAGAPDAPYFSATDAVVSRPLYASRLADQVDMRWFEKRVQERRFVFRSGVVWGSYDGEFQTRDSWAFPLRNIRKHSKRHLVVAVSRCVVDYRYPSTLNMPQLHNLALVSAGGRQTQVFRINSPRDLPGVQRALDIRRVQNRIRNEAFWRHRPLVDRFFDQLFAEQVPVATAELPLGSWRDASGADLVTIAFPEEDPGVADLRPREHLSMGLHKTVLAETLEARSTLWGDSFEFPIVSAGCRGDARTSQRQLVPEPHRFQMIAAATALSRVVPLLDRPLSSAGSGLVQEYVQRSGRLSGPEWHTRARAVLGKALSAPAWDESGRIFVTFGKNGRGKAVLAGLRRAGQDDLTAARVLATVEGIAKAEGARVSLMRADAHDQVFSLMAPDKGLDVSAELLRRGLVQLDVSDTAVLTQQPGLIRAAQQALLDPEARARPPVADTAYQQAVRELGTRLGVVL